MRDTNGDRVSLNVAAGLASNLLGSGPDANGTDAADHGGVHDLAKFVRQAKDAVAAARPEAILSDQVPLVMAELAAVIAETEEAAGVFLESAEQLETLSGNLPEDVAAKLNAIATAIFQASGFQDITGQRISNVSRIVKEIEERVAETTEAIGYQPDHDAAPPPEAGMVLDDQDLLNGPALPGAEASQDDIDALFD